jgi:hypothetical protein
MVLHLLDNTLKTLTSLLLENINHISQVLVEEALLEDEEIF